MAQTVNVHIKLDSDVKKSMEDVDPFYSIENISYLEKKMEDYRLRKTKTVEHNLIEE